LQTCDINEDTVYYVERCCIPLNV